MKAHYNLYRLFERLGDQELAAAHQRLHERYKADDNAQGRAIRLAREKYPAASHAAEAVVKYSLFREGAPELNTTTTVAEVDKENADVK